MEFTANIASMQTGISAIEKKKGLNREFEFDLAWLRPKFVFRGSPHNLYTLLAKAMLDGKRVKVTIEIEEDIP